MGILLFKFVGDLLHISDLFYSTPQLISTMNQELLKH